MATRPKKRLKAVPVADDPVEFMDSFNSFIDDVSNLHGRQAALSYRALREREAQAIRSSGGDYPPVEEQLADFLTFRTEQ